MSEQHTTFRYGIWREAGLRCRENALLIALIIAVLTIIELAGPVKGGRLTGDIISLVWCVLAVNVQSAIVNKAPFWSLSPEVAGTWAWRLLLLSIPGAAAGIAVLLLLLHRLDPQFILTIVLSVFAIVEAAVLAIAGTWLPATVAATGDQGFTAALRRGRMAFSYVLPRLVLGCGITGAASLAILYGGTKIFRTTEPLVMEEVGPDYALLLVHAVSEAGLAFVVVMMSIILSRAYLLTETANDVPR